MRNRQLLSLLLPLCAVVVATSLLIVSYDGPIRPLPERGRAGIRREIWLQRLNQAEEHLREGELEEAEELLRDFYREQPGNTRVLRLLIRINCLERRLDAAEKYCLELMNINPGDQIFITAKRTGSNPYISDEKGNKIADLVREK